MGQRALTRHLQSGCGSGGRCDDGARLDSRIDTICCCAGDFVRFLLCVTVVLCPFRRVRQLHDEFLIVGLWGCGRCSLGPL